MTEYEAVFGIVAGALLNPIIIMLKYWVLPKNLEGTVSDAVMQLTSTVLSMIVAFGINIIGNFSSPVISVVMLGLGVKQMSSFTNTYITKPLIK